MAEGDSLQRENKSFMVSTPTTFWAMTTCVHHEALTLKDEGTYCTYRIGDKEKGMEEERKS